MARGAVTHLPTSIGRKIGEMSGPKLIVGSGYSKKNLPIDYEKRALDPCFQFWAFATTTRSEFNNILRKRFSKARQRPR